MRIRTLLVFGALLSACGGTPYDQTNQCYDMGTRDVEPVEPNTCGPGLTLCRTTFYSCDGMKLNATTETCLDVPCPGMQKDYGSGGGGTGGSEP